MKTIALRLELNEVIWMMLGVVLKLLASHIRGGQNRKTICEATTLHTMSKNSETPNPTN